MSEALRRHFIKDAHLPIQVVSDDEFTYFMNLYDPIYNCWEQYKLFMNTVRVCGGESGYFKAVSDFIGCMVDAITETESFALLCATQNVGEYEPLTKPQKSTVYQVGYANKQMISIDICCANFNALKSFDLSAVLGCETYEELAHRFTDHAYIATNKQIRQVVFGRTAPDKLQQIQKSLIYMINDNIMSEYPEFKTTMVGSDELVVYEYGDYSIAEVFAFIKTLIPPFIDYIRCEAFTLMQVHPERHYFAKLPMKLELIKNYENETLNVEFHGYGNPAFKSVPTLFFAQVYKKYFKLPVTADDLIFIHEGLVARFDKSIYGD